MRVLRLLNCYFRSTECWAAETWRHQRSLLNTCTRSGEGVLSDKCDQSLKVQRIPSSPSKHCRSWAVKFVYVQSICLRILGEFVSELARVRFDQCIFATSWRARQYHDSRVFRHFHEVSHFLLINGEFLNCFGCVFVDPHFCSFFLISMGTLLRYFCDLIESPLLQIN